MKRGLGRYRAPFDPKDYTRYAKWLRKLEGLSGVYAIRNRDSREVLYVGESHSGRLRGTITRHFQNWSGYTAGTTYSRFAVEVALAALDAPRSDVLEMQERLIRELRPTDNVHHTDRGAADFDPDEFLPEGATDFDPASW